MATAFRISGPVEMQAPKRARRILLMVVAIVVTASQAFAQRTSTSSVPTTFAVAAQAKLSLSTTALSFPNSDPDTVPQITNAQIVTVKARTSGTILLTVQASDDFRSGMDTIAISNLTWTATGTGFVAGTMSKTSAVTAGSWGTSGLFIGTVTYQFRNSWTYSTGAYNTSLTYTLTAP